MKLRFTSVIKTKIGSLKIYVNKSIHTIYFTLKKRFMREKWPHGLVYLMNKFIDFDGNKINTVNNVTAFSFLSFTTILVKWPIAYSRMKENSV